MKLNLLPLFIFFFLAPIALSGQTGKLLIYGVGEWRAYIDDNFKGMVEGTGLFVEDIPFGEHRVRLSNDNEELMVEFETKDIDVVELEVLTDESDETSMYGIFNRNGYYVNRNKPIAELKAGLVDRADYVFFAFEAHAEYRNGHIGMRGTFNSVTKKESKEKMLIDLFPPEKTKKMIELSDCSVSWWLPELSDKLKENKIHLSFKRGKYKKYGQMLDDVVMEILVSEISGSGDIIYADRVETTYDINSRSIEMEDSQGPIEFVFVPYPTKEEDEIKHTIVIK